MTTQIRDDLAQALWETLLLNSSNGRLPHGDIKRIADEFGLGRNVVGRIWRKGLTSMDSCVAAVVKAEWSRRGRKKVDRAGLCERVAQVPVVDRENQRTLQLATNTSAYLISQLIKEGYLWRALRRTCQLLTPKHISDRMKYCADRVLRTMEGGHYFDPMYDVVHLDEKWFYVKKVGGKVYVLTGKDDVPIDDPPVQYAQSKRHIKKVMFLCAVARPRGDWDGKVGIWPVVETYTTQRASVNRPAGVEEVRPVSMTREIYRDTLVNDVIPAIKAKWPQDQKHIPIRLQQDNAKPHVHEDDAEVLAAGCSDGWMMHPLNQPAQSPDLNCLDLGYFASIQTLQSKTHPRTTVDLIKEVKLAFEETTAVTLNKTFLSLQAVMEQIMRCGGSNNYKLGHMHKDKLLRAGTLPISLPSDVNVFLNARDAILQPVTASIPGTQEACDLDVFLW